MPVSDHTNAISWCTAACCTGVGTRLVLMVSVVLVLVRLSGAATISLPPTPPPAPIFSSSDRPEPTSVLLGTYSAIQLSHSSAFRRARIFSLSVLHQIFLFADIFLLCITFLQLPKGLFHALVCADARDELSLATRTLGFSSQPHNHLRCQNLGIPPSH